MHYRNRDNVTNIKITFLVVPLWLPGWDPDRVLQSPQYYFGLGTLHHCISLPPSFYIISPSLLSNKIKWNWLSQLRFASTNPSWIKDSWHKEFDLCCSSVRPVSSFTDISFIMDVYWENHYFELQSFLPLCGRRSWMLQNVKLMEAEVHLPNQPVCPHPLSLFKANHTVWKHFW